MPEVAGRRPPWWLVAVGLALVWWLTQPNPDPPAGPGEPPIVKPAPPTKPAPPRRP